MNQRLPLTDPHLHERPLLLPVLAKTLDLMVPSGRYRHKPDYSDSVMKREKKMVNSGKL